MHRLIYRLKKRSRGSREINPEDIFIDSANLPGLNQDRMEGRIEKPIPGRTFFVFRMAVLFVALILVGKLWSLQVMQGSVYAEVSENNRLGRVVVFADRGVIFDRNGLPVVENSMKPGERDFAVRKYAPLKGLASILGYIRYPSKDKQGNYYDESYHGQAGVEKVYDSELAGVNGSRLTEYDAKGNLISESVAEAPKKGKDLQLALDARLNEKMYLSIEALALEKGFTGGAGIIMDVQTGEILALTSYPEYDSNLISSGENRVEINRLLKDQGKPFLNRAVSGLYTPGSIVKPIVALAALQEGIIDPLKKIESTGYLLLQNPYDKTKPTIFKDWKAHGWVDMRRALAVSSDVYFYQIGGGFENQKGLGIAKLNEYFRMFGFAEKTGIDLPAEAVGDVANPVWKAKMFPNDPDWRLGNTYHTSIGQYGTQVTPIVAVRWTAALANGGRLLIPSVIRRDKSDERTYKELKLPLERLRVVQEGMYDAVHGGSASGLSVPQVKVAGKTGTAELGAKKEFVNSWVTGYFPYENPRYAFVVIMERGPVANLVGATFVMRQVIDWMIINTPEYLK